MKFIATVFIVMLCMYSVHSSPAQEVVDTVEGILVGAFGEVGKEARTCLQDGEATFQYVEQAIANFKTGTTASIIEGLFYIGKALEELPEELKDCQELPELVKDFEKIAQEFKDPKSLAIHVGKEILFNGKSIYKDVSDSITQFETAQYEPAGEDIGDIVKILFIDEGVKGRKEVTEFVEGFFKGSLRDDSLDIIGCIDDSNEIIDQLEKIISDFENGLLENFEAVFLDIIDLLGEIPRSVLQCENIPAEITKFEVWAFELQDMGTMEKRLFNAFLKFSDRIKEDSKGLIDDYKRGLLRNSGYYLGDVLYVLFELVTPELRITEGMISGLLKN
eukprot:CAMPEP_0168333788 /NCGR_PEP_ID=MMETSP0213-20121227/9830_1 /TAXON_ID=151035 /ORGANISM="Euplotes harpa, Strain FSP1.4" /LENGTH=332 /DNA_ID=CAMNT_0008338207 /DNA_START=12 /DNA_END=1010 /DNA_ORIENTATION=-